MWRAAPWSRAWSLQPFAAPAAACDQPPVLALSCRLRRFGGRLSVRFLLSGSTLGSLLLPRPVLHPQRRHELWRLTCFELFVTRAEEKGYWELNVSPAGDWNLYRFDGYRQGMREEQGLPPPIIRQHGRDSARVFECTLDLPFATAGGLPLHCAPAAVLLDSEGHASFWALTHPAGQPDFHRRSGVLMPSPSVRGFPV